jgi:uncharacterized repeat protein (TIGR03803 family)
VSGTERVVYAFKGDKDSEYPDGSLIAVAGKLYGTTVGSNGNRKCSDECGTVFEVSTAGTERVVYSFKGGNDGLGPLAGLIDVDGTLYGTTGYGGANDTGTVFAVSTSGTERVLHSFGTGSGSDGKYPDAGLIAVGSELYGTTDTGGAKGYGSVFEVSTSGKERVLYSFGGGADGANPGASLIAVGGELYGTTQDVGANGTGGTVFKVSTSGTERVLHSFGSGSDGADPLASLIDVKGVLYGTTAEGGVNGGGTVFSISTSGMEHVLYRFKGGKDGAGPYAGLVDVNGSLYGTTSGGGGGANGGGTIFDVRTSGKESVLFSFCSQKGSYSFCTDGLEPVAGLIAVRGKLYSTTASGGTTALTCSSAGCGTVFEVTP